jgi:hypothetical protein
MRQYARHRCLARRFGKLAASVADLTKLTASTPCGVLNSATYAWKQR